MIARILRIACFAIQIKHVIQAITPCFGRPSGRSVIRVVVQRVAKSHFAPHCEKWICGNFHSAANNYGVSLMVWTAILVLRLIGSGCLVIWAEIPSTTTAAATYPMSRSTAKEQDSRKGSGCRLWGRLRERSPCYDYRRESCAICVSRTFNRLVIGVYGVGQS